jgi:hypothetical protein
MGIEAALTDERGVPSETVFDTHECVGRLVASRWHKLSDTKCLQFIEPWGDAIFNQSQIPHLVSELRAELLDAKEPRMREHIEKLVRLAEQAVDQAHTYIKFIGD